MVCCFLFFVLLAGRLFQLQVWNHERLDNSVNEKTIKNKEQKPLRGRILDRNGNIFALTTKSYEMFIDPLDAGDLKKVVSALRSVGVDLQLSFFIGKEKRRYVPIAKNFDKEFVLKVKSLNIKGVGFNENFNRSYPEGRTASHIIGTVRKDDLTGIEGVELNKDSDLRGNSLVNKYMVDARGRFLPEKIIDKDKLTGADVYLTIDKKLQYIAEQEIDKAFVSTNAKKGMVIIQDPSNGEILAMACRPNFDPSATVEDISVLRNPVVCDTYEPGSTFKLVTAAAALKSKTASRTDKFDCENGVYELYGKKIRDHEKRGMLTFDEIIEYSSNIGTVKIGQKIGENNLYRTIREFGFYSKSGLELSGEAKGILAPPEKWTGLSLPNISFGQGISVTPIQILSAYSCIVNGGTLFAPKIIKQIKLANGTIVKGNESNFVRKVITQEISDDLKDILKKVVENGTGKAAKVLGYSVGGKTGTAQKYDQVTNTYSTSKYIASFCGAIPLLNPKFTILVILDEPKGDYWGSSTAAPVFCNVASRAVRHMRIDPDDVIEIASKKE